MTTNNIYKSILYSGSIYLTVISLISINNFLLNNPTETKKNIFLGINYSILFGGCVFIVSHFVSNNLLKY